MSFEKKARKLCIYIHKSVHMRYYRTPLSIVGKRCIWVSRAHIAAVTCRTSRRMIVRHHLVTFYCTLIYLRRLLRFLLLTPCTRPGHQRDTATGARKRGNTPISSLIWDEMRHWTLASGFRVLEKMHRPMPPTWNACISMPAGIEDGQETIIPRALPQLLYTM